MKAYIQTDSQGDYYNVNAYVAAAGFTALAFEVEKFHKVEDISDHNAESIVVGGVGNVRRRLEMLGIGKKQEELEYPKELQTYLGRRVWQDHLHTIFADSEKWPLFIKPVETKIFPGKVVRNFGDFIGLDVQGELKIWCSDPIALRTEWRCFIRYGEVLDVRYYKGAWDSRLDLGIVRAAVADFASAPAAYALDFGVDEAGKHYLVEVNDGHSLGSYGMGVISYAKFLSARWAEMTSTQDYLYF